MPRHGRHADGEARGELAGGPFGLRQLAQHLAAGGGGERVEHPAGGHR